MSAYSRRWRSHDPFPGAADREKVMEFRCAQCGRKTDRPAGHVNRSRARGDNLYCGRRCAGLGRRKPPKTMAQKKLEKREYDKLYRARNLESIKAKKAAYFKRTYDPDAARIERKRNMPAHVEYCRQPKYKAWKRDYDRRYRAKEYGPFAEAYQLTIDLNREIKERTSNYEIRQQNKTWGKAQQRDRETPGPRRGRDHPPAHG